MAWGDPAARARAIAALDTINTNFVGRVGIPLISPALLPSASEVYAAALRRTDATPVRVARSFEVAFNRGKISAALAAAGDPRIETAPALLYLVHRNGLSMPAERIEAVLSLGPADTLPGIKPFYAGAYAAEQGRRADFEHAVARLRADAVALGAAGDSSGMRFTNGMIRGLDGYAAWREGRREDAATLLEVSRRSTIGFWPRELVNNTIRRWLAELYEEMGRPQDAATAWASLFGHGRPDTFATCSLGRVYTGLGEREKARQALEACLVAWKDADPALQSRVAEARRALGQL